MIARVLSHPVEPRQGLPDVLVPVIEVVGAPALDVLVLDSSRLQEAMEVAVLCEEEVLGISFAS
jgi:hypothetical protein